MKTENRLRRTEDGMDVIVNMLLKNRGLKTKKEREDFLNPDLMDVSLENVGISVEEVRKTIKRIKVAIKNNEKIIIYE